MSAFDSLHHHDQPHPPDQRFARRLRAEVTAALTPTIDLPERNPTMTDTATRAELRPYITVHDAAAAIEWYTSVFGARETTRYVGDDGRIGHGELDIGGAVLMLADEYPDFGAVSPQTVGGTPVKLYLEVDDVDAVWNLALERGADAQRPPEDQPYGRRACAFGDPFGHQWMVQSAQPVTSGSNTEEIEAGLGGDFSIVTSDDPTRVPVEVGYLTLSFDDTDKARAFYGALFGWRADDGHSGEGYAHVANTQLPMGMTPDGNDAPPQIYFRVDDTDRFAERVVELGGSVVDRAEYSSGANIRCLDDQGRAFTLWNPADGY